MAFDVRAGLAAAFGRDEAARDDARAVLFGTLFHQDTTYEATVDAVPLVIAYLADVDDDAWSKELWLWLGNVALSALLPPAKSASHGGAWGPGVHASLLASFRTSLAVMGPRDGSRFAPFASALHTATLRDEPAEGRTIVLAALKDLFHLEP